MRLKRKIILDLGLIGAAGGRVLSSSRLGKSPVILSCSRKKIHHSTFTNHLRKASSCLISQVNMDLSTLLTLDSPTLYHLIPVRLMNMSRPVRTYKTWLVNKWNINSTYSLWWSSSTNVLTSRGPWKLTSRSWFFKKTIQSIMCSNPLLDQERNSYRCVICKLNCSRTLMCGIPIKTSN